jgi:hypothetical protein
MDDEVQMAADERREFNERCKNEQLLEENAELRSLVSDMFGILQNCSQACILCEYDCHFGSECQFLRRARKYITVKEPRSPHKKPSTHLPQHMSAGALEIFERMMRGADDE